jgi:hypothetical protein
MFIPTRGNDKEIAIRRAFVCLVGTFRGTVPVATIHAFRPNPLQPRAHRRRCEVTRNSLKEETA